MAGRTRSGTSQIWWTCCWRVPVVRTEAAKGEGIAELAETIDAHRRHIEEEGTLADRRARNLLHACPHGFGKDCVRPFGWILDEGQNLLGLLHSIIAGINDLNVSPELGCSRFRRRGLLQLIIVFLSNQRNHNVEFVHDGALQRRMSLPRVHH